MPRFTMLTAVAVLLAACGDSRTEPNEAADSGVDVSVDAVDPADAPDEVVDGTIDASGDPESDVDPVPLGPCGPIGRRTVYAVYQLRFAVEESEGVAAGFDIDGATTAPGDETGCRKPDFTSPRGEPGIDNQFARLIPTLETVIGESPDDSLVRAVQEAELVLLFELESLDDRTSDECVSVNVYRGGPDVVFGTDGLLLAGQSYDIDTSRPWARVDQARVEGGRLHASGFRLELPLTFFSTNVDLVIADTFLELGLDEDDVPGMLGGAITLEDFIETVRDIDDGFASVAEGLLSTNADLEPDDRGRCQAISIAWTFGARTGHLYPDTVRP